MALNIVITLVLSVSLKAMWNMVHVLQIIIFLPILLEWPANAQLIVDSLEEAAELKKMTKDVYDALLPEDISELLTEEEDLQGKTSEKI